MELNVVSIGQLKLVLHPLRKSTQFGAISLCGLTPVEMRQLLAQGDATLLH